MTRRAAVLWSLTAAVSGLGFGGVGLKDLPAGAGIGDPVSGREIYVNTCLRCHGIDGKGSLAINLIPPPADLTSPAVQNRLDGTLFRRIHEGKPNTAMGAWKYSLSDDEIWDVLAYVRTLGANVGAAQP